MCTGSSILNLPAREENFPFFPFDISRSPLTYREYFLVDKKVGSKHYPLHNFDFDMITRFREKAKGKIVIVILLSRRAPAG